MNYFLNNIALRYARLTISTWTILFLLNILLMKYTGTNLNLFGTLFGYGTAMFISTTLMTQTQWPIFWRRTSETIQQFWLGVVAILLFNLALNGFCYLMFSSYKGPETDLFLFQTTAFEIFWVVIISFTISVTMLFNQKAILAKKTLKPARQFLFLMGIYVWIAAIISLFFYSRLLGYAFTEVSLLASFFFSNSFILGSIQYRTRIRSFFLATIGILILMGTNYSLEIMNSPEPSDFLGRIGPKKTWNFSDLEKIEKPSAWVNWMNDRLAAKANMEPEQMDQALMKLESICPIAPTDYPAAIICTEKNSEQVETVIRGKAEEPIILARLNSVSFYVKLFGVLSARQLDDLSPEIKTKLEEISHSTGRLNIVAEKTLSDHKKGNRAGLKIYVGN